MRTVHAEPGTLESARGREVLARFPGAEVVEVPSHWQIPELDGYAGNVERWVRVKGGSSADARRCDAPPLCATV